MNNRIKVLFLSLLLLGIAPSMHASKNSATTGAFKVSMSAAILYATETAKPSGIVRFLGYGLSGLLLISGLEDWGLFSSNNTSNNNNIDKAALAADIKADIYKVFSQEMWIVSKDFTGNGARQC
jgi:hypothetical protein